VETLKLNQKPRTLSNDSQRIYTENGNKYTILSNTSQPQCTNTLHHETVMLTHLSI